MLICYRTVTGRIDQQKENKEKHTNSSKNNSKIAMSSIAVL